MAGLMVVKKVALKVYKLVSLKVSSEVVEKDEMTAADSAVMKAYNAVDLMELKLVVYLVESLETKMVD
jgi:hypothetical protein